MLHYVEQGVKFTDQFGDIDEQFYNSMEKMFEDALTLAEKHKILSLFQNTCEDITRQACEGWGFKEGFNDTYNEFYDKIIT